jgi:MarR family transcriptional regulator, organic hydroperoxide resistance regulator
MASANSRQTAAAAAEAWRLLFTFFLRTRDTRDSVLKRFGLTPNEVRALGDLDVKKGRPMRSLADAWGTDASNATWVVDRLEKHGYAERRALPTDRRVKLVALTPKGAKAKSDVLKAMYEPPAPLLAMSHEDLQALTPILRKLLAAFNEPAGEKAEGGRI